MKRLRSLFNRTSAPPVPLPAPAAAEARRFLAAVEYGDVATCKKFIESFGSYLNTIKDKDGNNALMLAAQNISANHETIAEMLVRKMDLQDKNNKGQTALRCAVEHCNSSAADVIRPVMTGLPLSTPFEKKKFLSLMFDSLQAPPPGTRTPKQSEIRSFHHACRKDSDIDDVKKFLERYPRFIDEADEYGRTAVHMAAKENAVKNIKALAYKDADLNARTGALLQTPLMYALMLCSFPDRTVDELITLGADLAARDTTGRTALDYAIRQKNTSCEALLRDAMTKQGLLSPPAAPPPAVSADIKQEDLTFDPSTLKDAPRVRLKNPGNKK